MPDILTAFGLSASAGLNAYIPLLIVALMTRFGLIELQYPYNLIGSGWAIAALVFLLVVEILADKVPMIDHANDIIATFIRPTAGALLFAGSTGTVEAMPPVLALVLGFLVAGATHSAKATARPVITASTGGVGNPVISLLEDIAALLTSLVAILAPLLIGLAALLFGALFLWWFSRRRGQREVGADPG
jgi:hypothetical protein